MVGRGCSVFYSANRDADQENMCHCCRCTVTFESVASLAQCAYIDLFKALLLCAKEYLGEKINLGGGFNVTLLYLKICLLNVTITL